MEKGVVVVDVVVTSMSTNAEVAAFVAVVVVAVMESVERPVGTQSAEDEEGTDAADEEEGGVRGMWAVSREGSHRMAAAALTATSLTGSSVEKAYTWMRGRVVGLKMQW